MESNTPYISRPKERVERPLYNHEVSRLTAKSDHGPSGIMGFWLIGIILRVKDTINPLRVSFVRRGEGEICIAPRLTQYLNFIVHPANPSMSRIIQCPVTVNEAVSLLAILIPEDAKIPVLFYTLKNSFPEISWAVGSRFTMMEMKFYFAIALFTQSHEAPQVTISVKFWWEKPCPPRNIPIIILMFVSQCCIFLRQTSDTPDFFLGVYSPAARFIVINQTKENVNWLFSCLNVIYNIRENQLEGNTNQKPNFPDRLYHILKPLNHCFKAPEYSHPIFPPRSCRPLPKNQLPFIYCLLFLPRQSVFFWTQ